MKIKLLLILLVLSLILSGCKQEEKDVVIIDITDEEMETITQVAENLPERVAPPVQKPVNVEELIKVGVIAGESVQSLRLPIENFNTETQMKGLEVNLVEKREDLLKRMVDGELNAAIVSADLAAAMYNQSEGGIRIVGQNVETAIQLIENGQEVNAFSDLKGKSIYYSSEALPSKQILRVILQRNRVRRMNEKNYLQVDNYADLLEGLIGTPSATGIAIEDIALAVTMKNDDLRIALNVSDEWKRVTETNLLPVRCLVVRNDLPEMQLRRLHVFLNNEELQMSWRTSKGYEKDILTYMRIMNKISPELIGGEVPNEDIFFKWKPVE